MSTTIKDVAEAAGVSSATVSNVLNDKQNVGEDTRRKVRNVIAEMNYRPSASAQRRLQTSAQKSIGLVVKEIHNPYFADVILGAQEEATARGYDLMVATSEGKRETENHVVEAFVSRDLNGIIINPLQDAEADLSHLFELKRRNIPFVMLENVRGLSASLVDVDNASDYQRSIEYLIDLGHKRIVHFAGPAYSMHSDERVEGFQSAFFEAGLVYSNDFVVRAGASLDGGYEAGLEYFDGWTPRDGPTAVACYNDLVGIGLMRALREHGLAIPGDVSILGFDNIAFCDYAPVPMTSIGVPTGQMGRKAVSMLVRHMEDAGAHAPEVEILQAEMTIRASTAPPGQSSAA